MFEVLLRLKATHFWVDHIEFLKLSLDQKVPTTVNPIWFMYFFSIPDSFVSQPSVFLYEENKSPPKQSMYGISTYIYHKNLPNLGKYTHT